jgi:hypothetical protein
MKDDHVLVSRAVLEELICAARSRKAKVSEAVIRFLYGRLGCGLSAGSKGIRVKFLGTEFRLRRPKDRPKKAAKHINVHVPVPAKRHPPEKRI